MLPEIEKRIIKDWVPVTEEDGIYNKPRARGTAAYPARRGRMC